MRNWLIAICYVTLLYWSAVDAYRASSLTPEQLSAINRPHEEPPPSGHDAITYKPQGYWVFDTSNTASVSTEVYIGGDAANVLSLRNGYNPQQLRVYGR